MLHRPSFISFGIIKADDVIDVYEETRRSSITVNPTSHEEQMLDIPGLLIQHTKSIHEHLPCVDDEFEEYSGEDEEVLKVTSDTKINDTPDWTISQQSSYEILVIPSRTNSMNDGSNQYISKVTLVHVIDDVPVLVSEGTVSSKSQTTVSTMSIKLSKTDSEKISLAAKTLVQVSLGSAAKSLGFSNEDILKQIGISLETVDNVVCHLNNTDVVVSKSVAIIDYAKQITEVSLIGAAVSLGFYPNQITEALGINPVEDRLEDISTQYNNCIQKMAKEAIFQSALSLGYNEDEAYAAINEIVPSFKTELQKDSSKCLLPKESSLTILARDLAKSAIDEATKRLGITEDLSEHILVEDTLQGQSFTKVVSSTFNLKAVNSCEYDPPDVVVTYNALRNAAISLGYSDSEVYNIIGPEKIPKGEAIIRKWARLLVEKALDSCTSSQQIKGESSKQIKGESSQQIKSDVPSSPMHAEDSIVIEPLLCDSFFTRKYEKVDSEYLVKRYSSCYLSEISLPDKTVECTEKEISDVSKVLVFDAVCNAARDLGFSRSDAQKALVGNSTGAVELLESQRQDGDDDEENLKNIAQDIVSGVMFKAVQIVKEEQKKPKFKSEEKRLKSFALKLSMVIIGSAGKRLGYNDNEIISSLLKDISTIQGGKFPEKHPNAFVKFNEDSIDRTRRESLSIPGRDRRESIKDRPSTPKPSLDILNMLWKNLKIQTTKK